MRTALLNGTHQPGTYLHMLMQVVFNDSMSGQAHKASAGQCCFDPHRGHLCVALKPQGGPFACFGGNKHASPRDKTAERYSLLRKLTITEPSPNVLELNFTVADKEGAQRIVEQQNLGSSKAKQRRLERIAISPCSATEIKVCAIFSIDILTSADMDCMLKANARGCKQEQTSVSFVLHPCRVLSCGCLQKCILSGSSN